jgi:NAD(P)-dependent dehydrogenase (short-subunit alcohol dehydrogenase family)
MIPRRCGLIVNISSAASTNGSPGEYVWYAASKGAIDSLTIGLAKELAPHGIRVNAVQPGMVETEIHALSSEDPGRVERIKPMIPLQRIGRPDEIADAVMYLLSDKSSYATGAILRVSGGR